MITTLVDTNILVYAAGVNTDKARQTAASNALNEIHHLGALPVQALSEFAAVLLRHNRPADVILQDVEALADTWPVLHPTARTVTEALAGVKDYQLSFWDAMLWAIAVEHGLSTILSEDGPTGHSIRGVQYVSPF